VVHVVAKLGIACSPGAVGRATLSPGCRERVAAWCCWYAGHL
jgi:hypothetical protein